MPWPSYFLDLERVKLSCSRMWELKVSGQPHAMAASPPIKSCQCPLNRRLHGPQSQSEWICYAMKCTIYKAFRYAIFSVKFVFSLASCSQILWISSLPLSLDSRFYTHTK
jgi:hypothetical protein